MVDEFELLVAVVVVLADETFGGGVYDEAEEFCDEDELVDVVCLGGGLGGTYDEAEEFCDEDEFVDIVCLGAGLGGTYDDAIGFCDEDEFVDVVCLGAGLDVECADADEFDDEVLLVVFEVCVWFVDGGAGFDLLAERYDGAGELLSALFIEAISFDDSVDF